MDFTPPPGTPEPEYLRPDGELSPAGEGYLQGIITRRHAREREAMINEENKIVANIRLHRDSTWHQDDDGSIKRWTLEFEDEASGLHFFTVELTDAQYAALHSSSGAQDVDARVIPTSYLGNLGRISWHVAATFATAWDGDPTGKPLVRLENLIESAALAQEIGALGGSARSNRPGLAVRFSGFSDTPELAVTDSAKAAENLRTLIESNGWVLASDRGTVTHYPTEAHLESDHRRSRRKSRAAE